MKEEKMQMKSLNNLIVFASTMFVLGGLSNQTRANWNVAILHPAGAAESQALGASGTQQVGYFDSDGFGGTHASLWSGSAGSLVDLNPAGAAASKAFGISGTQQVGYANLNIGGQHAGLWNGSAASFVDLHPTGAFASTALATSGPVQVGSAYITTTSASGNHASLWTGSAGSWVDLTPAGSSDSSATAVTGDLATGTQAGYAYVGISIIQAGIWHGTAASWTVLNPDGVNVATVNGMAGTQQVGSTGNTNFSNAALWTGTKESYVNLAPPGSSQSYAYATDGTYQVGAASFGINDPFHAGVWYGTAGSWEDLSQYLPTGAGESYATGVWSDGPNIYISGYYQSEGNLGFRAVVWSQPFIPEPASLGLLGASAIIALRRSRR